LSARRGALAGRKNTPFPNGNGAKLGVIGVMKYANRKTWL
jgi:hypothetical protein